MKTICALLFAAFGVTAIAEDPNVLSRLANSKIGLEEAEAAAKAAERLAEARRKAAEERHNKLIRERQLELWKREDEEREQRQKAAQPTQPSPPSRSEPPNLLAEDISKMKSSVAEFKAGFKVGYKRAFPLGVCPLPPLPPTGRSTFADGFGVGYSYGLNAEAEVRGR